MKNIFWLFSISISLSACGDGGLPAEANAPVETIAPVANVASVAPVAEKLALAPSLATIAIQQTTSFVASGGKAPYRYDLVGTNAGQLSNNVFTAAIVGESVKVRVTDADGATAEATANVTPPAMVSVRRAKNANGGRYFAVDASVPTGYVADTMAFRLLRDPIEGKTIPFYRCSWTYMSFVLYFNTNDVNCDNVYNIGGYRNEVTLGHLYKDQQPGAVLLKRYDAGDAYQTDSINPADADVSGASATKSYGYALSPQ